MGIVLGGAVAPMRGQSSLGDARLAVFGGPAFRTAAVSRPFLLGMSGDASLFRAGGGRLGVGALAEGGLYHPAISGKGNYYFSADGMFEAGQRLAATEAMRARPFAVAGYTKMFNATDSGMGTAVAMNFGVGVDRVIRDDLWLRVEVRDCYTPASDSHALVLRIGLVAVWSRE
jgi:hypothetical protein